MRQMGSALPERPKRPPARPCLRRLADSLSPPRRAVAQTLNALFVREMWILAAALSGMQSDPRQAKPSRPPQRCQRRGEYRVQIQNLSQNPSVLEYGRERGAECIKGLVLRIQPSVTPQSLVPDSTAEPSNKPCHTATLTTAPIASTPTD
ncbi:hypothetical protein AAFF_G00243190 [Aldrovandia affinis]|uniref:Uncharacterized protein n=1 Tax=Aldrovandia affinis TaxID=143900 RepID=A0AAD7RDN7_9TELE|nr:hypothetical protein AAFF_G00243190 [Aldrovandia affinis]